MSIPPIPPQLLMGLPPGAALPPNPQLPGAPGATPTPLGQPPAGLANLAPPGPLPLPGGAPPIPPVLGQIGQMTQQLNPDQMLSGFLSQADPNAETSFSSSGGPAPPGGLTNQASPFNDPVLSALSNQFPRVLELSDLLTKDTDKPGYLPLPDWSYVEDCTQNDKRLYQPLVDRFGRDLALYRQYATVGGYPPLYDPVRDIHFPSATIPNVVNKLTNMSSGLNFRFLIDSKDEKSKQAAQVIENWHQFMRDQQVWDYVEQGGGNLQWDEFWMLYQTGRIVYRILPDTQAAAEKNPFPFFVSLLDPSTVFPTFGGQRGKLVRVTRVYQSRMVDVLADYGSMAEGLRDKILSKVSMTERQALNDSQVTGEVTEYWDTWNHAVTFRGTQIFLRPHKLGFVPFVYAIAKGEPRNVTMPNGQLPIRLDQNNNVLTPIGLDMDLVEKGTAVYHHIIKSDKLTEVVYTLLVTEILKASNPPTITYSAPQLGGEPPPPLATYAGAQNFRKLNYQKVDSIPTSPRPTDVSPVVQRFQSDITQGTINAAMFGGVDGSNVAGFAIESLISAARDTVLPYEQAFQYAQGLKAEMLAREYVQFVAPFYQMAVPMEGRDGGNPSVLLQPEMFQVVGYRVKAEILGVPDQALPMIMQASTQGVHEGFWSRQHAMVKLGIKDTDRELSQIIRERAMEHPELMENFVIPVNFIKAGQEDLAKLWLFWIVMPKIIPMMSTMTGMGGPGGTSTGMANPLSGGIPSSPTGPGGAPGNGPPPGLPAGPPPGMNGMSNPMMLRAQGRPTGPLPGQGSPR